MWVLIPAIWKGEIVGLTSKRLGWLHTFLNCMRTFITLSKLPLARVSFVLDKWIYKGFFLIINHHLLWARHEVIVQIPLPLWETAHGNVFVLLGHLLLNLTFQSSQQERSQNFMQPLEDTLVELILALNHSSEWIGKPLSEVFVGLKHVRHQKVHERPQLHQVVLQRRSRQEKSSSKKFM